MGKVRRIDWSPAEWLAGTRGLGWDETAVYITVLNIIYDRGSACPNDAEFIAGHLHRGGLHSRHSMQSSTRRAAVAINDLCIMGKLRRSEDGEWLTNGRADIELGKASQRIDDASRAGIASGRARRAARHPVGIQFTSSSHPVHIHPAKGKTSRANGLARTPVPITITNHQSSLRENSTDPAREAERAASARPARDAKPEPPATTADEFIRDLGVDPASVPTPPPPVSSSASDTASGKQVAKSDGLLEAAKAARRKLMGGGS